MSASLVLSTSLSPTSALLRITSSLRSCPLIVLLWPTLSLRDYLNDHGIVATIRRELGSDISAACGQLRKQNLK